MLGQDNDWLEEVNEQEARRVIAEKQEQKAVKTHYEVGYQGGLIEKLEQQEEKVVLQTIRQQLESKVPDLTREFYPFALEQLKKVKERNQLHPGKE